MISVGSTKRIQKEGYGMVLDPDVQRLRDGLSGKDQEVFDTVVSLAYDVNPSFQNRLQWKVPTFTLNNDWHHWIFSLAKTKMNLTMTFHKGWLLDDPSEELSGDGKHLRMLRFAGVDQIKGDVLQSLMRSAIRHQKDM
jgi:hypothetical protein